MILDKAATPARAAFLPYRPRSRLLTDGDRRFFQQGLKPAVCDSFMLSFKVRLADVINAQARSCSSCGGQ